MSKYRLLPGGSFTFTGKSGDDKTYVPGEVVDTDVKLDELFVNRFEKVTKPVKSTKAQQATQDASEDEDAPSAPEKAPKGEKGQESPIDEAKGKDVTDKFPQAVKNDFTVLHQVGVGHVVTDNGVSLHDEPLKTKKQVEDFLDKHLGGGDEK